MRFERVLSVVMSFVFALVLSPIIGFFSGVVWLQCGGKESGGVCAFVMGSVSFVLILWKSDHVFRKILDLLRCKLPEPAHSAIEFGIVGAFLFGGIMLTGILVLGHTRPIGWDFDRVLPSMGLGFTFFLIGGLPIGFLRKRRKGSSV